MILVDEKLALSRVEVADSRVTCIRCGDGSIITIDGSFAYLRSKDSSNTDNCKHVSYKNILFLYVNKARCDICTDMDTCKVEELYNKYKFFVIPENLKETYMADNYEYRKSPSTTKTLFLLKDADSYIEKDKDSDNLFKIKCPYGELSSILLDRDERAYTTFILSPSPESNINKCIFNERDNSYTPFVYDWCNDKMYRDGGEIIYAVSDCGDEDNTQNNTKKDDIIIPPKPRNKLSDLLSNVRYFDKDHNIGIVPGETTIKFCMINPCTFLMCSGENQYDSDGYMMNISNVASFTVSFSDAGYKQFFDILTAKNEKCRMGMAVPKITYMTHIDDVFIVDHKPYTNISGEELKYEPLHVLEDKEDE